MIPEEISFLYLKPICNFAESTIYIKDSFTALYFADVEILIFAFQKYLSFFSFLLL